MIFDLIDKYSNKIILFKKLFFFCFYLTKYCISIKSFVLPRHSNI